MRILYYAFEYYCNYGARTHAQEFYHALKEHPLVNYAVVFPQNNSYDSISSTSKIEKTGVIKLLAKKIIPGHWISLYRMVWPKHAVYAQLKELIYREKIQYAIMRIGDQFQYIKYLKRDFPQLKVIVEMNATSFVEANRKVSFVENWKKYEASHLAVADAIITVSSYWKDYLIEYGVNENKIYVNPNGVNQSKFNDRMDRIAIRRNFGIPATSMVIGYVGGMETFRRLPEVIELLATFLNKNEKDFFIFIAGTGADIEKVNAKISENYNTFRDRIFCAGVWYPYEQIPSIISMFDIAIFPFSNPYGSPLKIFEYLWMGVPTIGPDIPILRELFTDGKHLLLAKQDGSDFLSLLNKLTSDPGLSESLSCNGKGYVQGNFTWHHNVSRIISVINNLQ